MIAEPVLKSPDLLQDQILEMFVSHSTDELQLLDIAALAHISGRLTDLRHAADALVESGALRLNSRHGGRYYRLAQ